MGKPARRYLEYLVIQNLDIRRTRVMEGQTNPLSAQADSSCIVMLSMPLLMYDQAGHTGEYVPPSNIDFQFPPHYSSLSVSAKKSALTGT